MADALITGTTLVENVSRSAGDIPVGGIVEWDSTFSSVPENFRECNGGTVNDPVSSYNGSAVPDLNTNYHSIMANKFKSLTPDVDDISYDGTSVVASTNGITFILPIELPNGITITSCVVEGNAAATAESWTLNKVDFVGGNAAMATALIGTADTTITNAIIDNQNFSYGITTTSLDTNDTIYGVKIIYTTRFKFIIRIK